MSVITGSKEVFPQPTSYGQNDAGSFSIIPFESTDPNKINALAAQFQALGYNYNVEHSFGKSKITLQLAFNPLAIEAPVDLWEYFAQSAQKDLVGAVVPSGLTSRLSDTVKNKFRAVFQSYGSKEPTDPLDVTNDPTQEAFWIGILGAQTQEQVFKDVVALYTLYLNGFTDFVISVPVLRHTQTVSYVYPISVPMLNVGRIISTSSLLAMESIPANIGNNLPNDVQMETGTKRYGWKKEFPTIQQIAFRKFQIVQEFSYGLWETQIYSPNPPQII